ncbi:MAG: ribonuclease HIII [Candidatus Cloacimonadota bacterium]|nr:MAG: ribonuclease HIII [Candidatus Cloacimonadota bacterium]
MIFIKKTIIFYDFDLIGDSMKEDLSFYKKKLSTYLEDNEIVFSTKDIPYGCKFDLLSESCNLTMYYGKKGFSFRMQGKNKIVLIELEDEFSLLFAKTQKSSDTKDNLSASYTFSYMGSDETGKGDYFGPLVAVGVCLAQGDEDLVIQAGAKDSKQLNDTKIIKIAKKLYKLGFDKVKIVSLVPSKYNELYKKFSAQGKTLNDLMGWLHATIIKDLYKKNPKAELAIVDKFGKESYVLSNLGKDESNLKILQVPKAEKNLAVAAASIIARYELLKWHDKIRTEYEVDLALGAGQLQVSQAKRFVSKYGRDKLQEIAKLHFKSTKEVDSY